jgi:hypothetical protein
VPQIVAVDSVRARDGGRDYVHTIIRFTWMITANLQLYYYPCASSASMALRS